MARNVPPGTPIDHTKWFAYRLRLKAGESVKKGDFLVPSVSGATGTTVDDAFEVAAKFSTTSSTRAYSSGDINIPGGSHGRGIIFQAIAPETGGAIDGEVLVQAVGRGSYVVGYMGGAVDPGSLVKLHYDHGTDTTNKTGKQEWVAANSSEIGSGVALGVYHNYPSETAVSRSADGDFGVVELRV